MRSLFNTNFGTIRALQYLRMLLRVVFSTSLTASITANAATRAAAAASKTLLKAADDETLLALYSLFKQASLGDIVGERPGVLDMVNRAKFDAWSGRKGMTRDDAMKAYVDLINRLKQRE